MHNWDKEKFTNEIRKLYIENGPSKSMGFDCVCNKDCYFLLRKFKGLNDLLIIFKAGHCPYSCSFCNLNNPSQTCDMDVLSQFILVCNELKHSLSIVERITISNNNSVLNDNCFKLQQLLAILKSIECFRNLEEVVLETNMIYVNDSILRDIKNSTSKSINILVGFETLSKHIRDDILNKPESVERFLLGLDDIGRNACALTAYLLYKPHYLMSDIEAYEEAQQSIDFLSNETQRRNIPFSLRINPMYAAKGTRWGEQANNCDVYRPPLLSDVLEIAEYSKNLGISTYIGLSTENSNELYGCYRDREDFSKDLLKKAILFNLKA